MNHSLTNLPNPQRHNMYHAVHKGIRLMHGRLLAAIGATDFSSAEETVALFADLRTFLSLGHTHLHSEDEEIHSAIKTRSATATTHAEEDHADHEESFAELESLIQSIEEAPAAKRPGLGYKLYLRYALFAAADLEHMHGEETELLADMHRLFSDCELRAIEGRIVAKSPPDKMAGFLRMIIPALSHPERVGMLGGMREAMPPEVFDGIIQQAVRPTLTDKEFARLSDPLKLAVSPWLLPQMA